MTGTGYPAGYPAQGISEVLSFQTIAAGGFKQGVPDFSGGKATLQEQDATGLSKCHGEREQEALQEQAAIRTRLTYLPSLPLLACKMLASMKSEHGFKSICNTLGFSHTSDVH